MRSVLAIDLGKTGCRAALWRGDERTEAAGPGAPGLAAADGVALAEQAILAIAKPLLRQAGLGRAEGVAIGVAGATAAPAAARRLGERLLAALPAETVAVASDAVAWHAGALGGAPGAVVAIGTGTVAVALAADGGFAQIDGWGPWLGDDGSGAWLGLAGLRAALRAHDGRGPNTVLREAAAARFGPLAELPAVLQGDANPARRAAAFAPDVLRAAEAGDAVAATLLAQAIDDLAATAQAAVRRVGGPEPVTLALTGGLLDSGPALLHTLHTALARGPVAVAIRPAVGTALDGARLLAGRTNTLHERQVLRVAQAADGAAQPPDLPATEGVRPGLDDLDQRPVEEIVGLLIAAEAAAQTAVARAVPQVAAAAAGVAERLLGGGRLFYLGAGTPGRLAMLDAAELGPTFSAPPDLVVALLAGGPSAMTQAVEDAEDDEAAAAAALAGHHLSARDAVVGITASGRTPYVLGGLRAANAAGALSVAVVNNSASPAADIAALRIELLTGAEVIAGSTRLTAGTTQKIVLNALSTAVMVQLGKTFGARMVDVRASNAKLRRRALRMVREITGASPAESETALAEAGGRVKQALVSLLCRVDATEAARRLEAAGGRVRAALAAGGTS